MAEIFLPPMPTGDEVVDRMRFNPRMSLMWEAMKYILLEVMPDALLRANARLDMHLPIVRQAIIARKEIDNPFPYWVVSSSHGLQAFSPAQVVADGNMVIYLAYGPSMSEVDRIRAAQMIDVLNNCMEPFMGGLEWNQRNVWNACVPGNHQFLDIPEWKQASGLAQYFDVKQFPGSQRFVELP